ncbi:hypothetical protein RHSIM_Rhsim08G0094900 [Rhododendron simsii]|uniref:LOB domain-containing protein n=1 Tax=Rhododendron simsii TaxID=118357 RepID=A0A834GI75_RHOSS|nr:hypothetical protein RHSIM_Rhsim08G0094900 [Rhododendron simsii]
MSCNGCRVLRKGCSENCILRPCLQWIESPESQGHATLFVAKFFGRAGLMSFISAVPLNQRPALFQSLLFEACGRTVNPVNGAVGLLWTGNWHLCQAAVQTVLRGGALRPLPEFLTGGAALSPPDLDAASEAEITCTANIPNLDRDPSPKSESKAPKRRRFAGDQLGDLRLSLTPSAPVKLEDFESSSEKRRRDGTPSFNSEESGTSNCFESGGNFVVGGETKILNLFN